MTTTARFAGLAGHKYCQLVTFRRTGAGVPTPVWFALEGDRLYVKTERPSGKLKRIRNDARVEVAPCTLRGRVLGAFATGRARVLDATEAAAAERALRTRYGLVRRLFGLVVEPIFALRGLAPAYLEVVPAGADR
jgi:PPOX class probable F420-dependent enzyme